MGGHIGVAVNENGDKFLVWKLVQVDKDSESATATIYVVDAGDADNTTTITKEFDHSMMGDKFNQYGEKRADKIDKIQQRLSEPTGDAGVDAARTTFVEKLQELKAALESGDSERASELRDELKDLRSELGNIRSFRR